MCICIQVISDIYITLKPKHISGKLYVANTNEKFHLTT